ncbi:single-stranded DNA-binding protein [Enterococcus faecium]|uniref:single-stranded DNA-binding protein n=1 Tax=Enterococcus faecium TaxID=1352 RepID=UPI0021B07531
MDRIQDLPKGTIFTLPDLYTGLEWKSFSKADRILLGRLFSAYALTSSLVDIIGKTSNNKKKYLKK